MNEILHEAYAKAKEADRHVAELEAEVQKANAQVEAHGNVVEETKTETENAQPVSPEVVDEIETEVDAVVTQ